MAIDFELSESQTLLKRSLRELLERECPESLVREAEASDANYSPELWRKLSDLGFLGLGIPEEYGGSGDFLDLGLFFEEAGRVLMPGPHLATLAIAAQAIAANGTEEQKRSYLEGITAAKVMFALAVGEESGEYTAGGVDPVALRDGDGYVLNGTKMFVKDTGAATHLLVMARTDPSSQPELGLTSFLVPMDAPGVEVRRFHSIAGDMLAEVTFRDVIVPAEAVLGEPHRGWYDMRDALEKGKACLAALMAGAAEALLKKTVDYMNQRVTFGRPISSYQALQHRMAHISQLAYGARHLAYNVLWKLSQGMPCASEVAMAKMFASDAYRQTTNEAHQFHGAYGYSLEFPVQLYWRRMRLDEVILGDSWQEREIAARALDL